MSNQFSDKKKVSRLQKRRAVADIISTMLLMGVTISGATTLTYFVNGTEMYENFTVKK